jgi:hypothetical protein
MKSMLTLKYSRFIYRSKYDSSAMATCNFSMAKCYYNSINTHAPLSDNFSFLIGSLVLSFPSIMQRNFILHVTKITFNSLKYR